MSDDYYPYRVPTSHPGWFAVFLISLATSCAVVVGFQWASAQGLLPAALKPQGPATAPAPAEEEPAHVKVPALASLPLEVASELLETRGLRLVVQEKSEHDTVPENAVIAQDPLPNSSLPRSSAVNVTLSTGKPKSASVPDLTGKDLEAAKAELEAAGFSLGEVSGPESGERVVASSTPAAGSAAPTGSAVALTLEAVGVEVPTLVGLPWGKAKKLIEERGLAVGKVRERFDEDREAYVVLQQTPSAGTRVAAGSKLDLVRNEGD